MKLVIDLDKVAYDLVTGKIETANIDLFSTLINAVQTGTPLEEELELGHCKDCDRWKQGKRCSDEGFCNIWSVITGEKFYCAYFEAKENKE